MPQIPYSAFTSAADLTRVVSHEIAKHTEATLLAQLNDFISRGLIEVEYGPMRFHSSEHGASVTYSQSVALRLKDREYVERLERENKAMREALTALQKAIQE